MKGWMYILERVDGTYYTGSTNDLAKRFFQHQPGPGADYTKMRFREDHRQMNGSHKIIKTSGIEKRFYRSVTYTGHFSGNRKRESRTGCGEGEMIVHKGFHNEATGN